MKNERKYETEVPPSKRKQQTNKTKSKALGNEKHLKIRSKKKKKKSSKKKVVSQIIIYIDIYRSIPLASCLVTSLPQNESPKLLCRK